MLQTTELDYELPESSIATVPASPRDSARLMVVHRATGAVDHLLIRDLPDLLAPTDLLVRNCTSVLPARFCGVRTDTGGKVEGLYLSDEPCITEGHRCRVLLKMRRHKPGAAIALTTPDGQPSGYRLVLEARAGASDSPAPDETPTDSGWIVRIESDTGDSARWLDAVGLTPLPPYIIAARKKLDLHIAEPEDRAAYQTVFAAEPVDAAARPEHGSVAAPTAGLHFTPELLARIAGRGVQTADVILHVGMGTFKPVETEFVEHHPMHTEWCMVPAESARRIREAKATGGRVIAIGTTAARTLESFTDPAEMERLSARSTRLLITPGYRWKTVDALLTNFHLPRSTLMAMVSALLPGGPAQLRSLYAEALQRGYRFYSFGDAMLVL